MTPRPHRRKLHKEVSKQRFIFSCVCNSSFSSSLFALPSSLVLFCFVFTRPFLPLSSLRAHPLTTKMLFLVFPLCLPLLHSVNLFSGVAVCGFSSSVPSRFLPFKPSHEPQQRQKVFKTLRSTSKKRKYYLPNLCIYNK